MPKPKHPAEAATLLVQLIRRDNPDMSDDVIVVSVVCDGGLLGGTYQAEDYSRPPGRRIVRLTYRWDDVRDYLDDLTPLAQPGHVLRAKVRRASIGTDALAVSRRVSAGVAR